VKVTFDFDKRQIAIDGDAPQMVEILQAARELAPLLSQIQINTVASAPTAARQSAERSTGGAATNGSSPVNIGMTMKQWVRQLRLDNNYERVAAIAEGNVRLVRALWIHQAGANGRGRL
jgi:hypothetical protein